MKSEVKLMQTRNLGTTTHLAKAIISFVFGGE